MATMQMGGMRWWYIGILSLSCLSLLWSQPLPFREWMPVYDTVYVLGDIYLEVSLIEQKLWVHRRNAPPIMMPISSGTSTIPEGMETPTGIFTIQNKARLAISRQFDSTRMYWWMGFSGNFGIHALDGYGYYRYLGKKPSSHGCIRIAREDGEKLYDWVSPGTPIIIYILPPARILAFADSTFDTTAAFRLTERSWQLEQYLEERLCRLYAGEYLLAHFPPLFLDGTTVLRHAGFDTGDFYRIPLRQKLPWYSITPPPVLSLPPPYPKQPIAPISIDDTVIADK